MITNCNGKLIFQQEIHNGNDAYKCNLCGRLEITKLLPDDQCVVFGKLSGIKDRIPVDDEQPESGPFNSTPTPYMKDILNLLKPGDITTITVLKGAAVGICEGLYHGMGYITVMGGLTLALH